MMARSNTHMPNTIGFGEKKNKIWSDKFLANLIRNKKYPTTATFFLPDQEQCGIS